MKPKRINRVVAIGIGCGLLAAAVVTPSFAVAADRVEYFYLEGDDRFETSVAVSKEGFSGTASMVFLVSGADFPDALSAAPAAAVNKAPMLLTRASGIPQSVESEIKRLHPDEIVIVGGGGAVSSSVEQAAGALAAKVSRVSGSDRYETSRKVVERFFSASGNAVYVATGASFPDALSAGALAGAKKAPVLLVNGGKSELDSATKSLLKKLNPAQMTIVGGPAAVSEKVEQDARIISAKTDRLAGANRYATSAAVAATWGKSDEAFVAKGYDFPDALCGAALAGMRNTPLVVSAANAWPAEVNAILGKLALKKLFFVGGYPMPNLLPSSLVEESEEE